MVSAGYETKGEWHSAADGDTRMDTQHKGILESTQLSDNVFSQNGAHRSRFTDKEAICKTVPVRHPANTRPIFEGHGPPNNPTNVNVASPLKRDGLHANARQVNCSKLSRPLTRLGQGTQASYSSSSGGHHMPISRLKIDNMHIAEGSVRQGNTMRHTRINKSAGAKSKSGYSTAKDANMVQSKEAGKGVHVHGEAWDHLSYVSDTRSKGTTDGGQISSPGMLKSQRPLQPKAIAEEGLPALPSYPSNVGESIESPASLMLPRPPPQNAVSVVTGSPKLLPRTVESTPMPRKPAFIVTHPPSSQSSRPNSPISSSPRPPTASYPVHGDTVAPPPQPLQSSPYRQPASPYAHYPTQMIPGAPHSLSAKPSQNSLEFSQPQPQSLLQPYLMQVPALHGYGSHCSVNYDEIPPSHVANTLATYTLKPMIQASPGHPGVTAAAYNTSLSGVAPYSPSDTPTDFSVVENPLGTPTVMYYPPKPHPCYVQPPPNSNGDAYLYDTTNDTAGAVTPYYIPVFPQPLNAQHPSTEFASIRLNEESKRTPDETVHTVEGSEWTVPSEEVNGMYPHHVWLAPPPIRERSFKSPNELVTFDKYFGFKATDLKVDEFFFSKQHYEE